MNNNTLEEEKTKSANTIDRKDFMRQVGMGFGAIMLLNCLQSCSESEIPDPDPNPNGNGKKDFTINFGSGTNAALQTKGGFVVIAAQNVIIARTLSDSFIAVASACTHEGTTINYRSATNDFLCPNHLSEFSDTGAVKKGPATTALKKYNLSVDLNASTLRVFE
jgi:cytochrome b6-f complex iron-sulfur subunit